MRADAAEARSSEHRFGQAARPEPTHHEIRPFTLERRANPLVEACAELVRGEHVLRSDRTGESPSSGAGRRREHGDAHVVSVAVQETRSQRQTEIRDAKRQDAATLEHIS